MSVRARLKAALASNLYGYCLTLLTQIASVPLLLYAWGPSLYGEWILASTIPGYLMLSDLGIGSALGNAMAMSVARGDRQEALVEFQSAALAIGIITFSLLATFLLIIGMFPVGLAIGIASMNRRELVILLTLLLTQVLVWQQQSVLNAGFRCEGFYAFSLALSNTVRFIEFMTFALVALLGGKLVAAAASMLVVRTLAAIATAILLFKWVSWLSFGISKVRREAVLRLLNPGIKFLAFPLANAINLQTPLLIIGNILGPHAVVAFSTARTITRSIQQLTNIANSSFWPEMSRAFGAEDIGLLKRLFRLSAAISIWGTIFSAVGLALFGRSIYEVWTDHIMALDPLLFDLLLLVMVINSIWFTPSVVLAATNRHGGLAIASLAANALVPPLGWAFAQLWGLHGIAASLLVCEIILSIYVVPASLRLVTDTFAAFVRSLIFPIYLIWPSRKNS